MRLQLTEDDTISSAHIDNVNVLLKRSRTQLKARQCCHCQSFGRT